MIRILICCFFDNCERFFLTTHRLSIVKTSISSFPPYFRNLELNVLGNIFYHHSTIKYKRRLNISQKRRWRQSHRCQRRNLRTTTAEGAKKAGLVKTRRQLSGRRPKKEVKFQWLDIEPYFQSDVIKFYEQNTFFSLKSRDFEKYCPAKKPQVLGK